MNNADPRAQAIAAAAADLNAKREAWLNPPDLVTRVPEVVPGYPDRLLPKDDAAAEVLKKRTLTNLYNQRPAWLDHAAPHRSTPRWPRPTAGATTGGPAASATTRSSPASSPSTRPAARRREVQFPQPRGRRRRQRAQARMAGIDDPQRVRACSGPRSR